MRLYQNLRGLLQSKAHREYLTGMDLGSSRTPRRHRHLWIVHHSVVDVWNKPRCLHVQLHCGRKASELQLHAALLTEQHVLDNIACHPRLAAVSHPRRHHTPAADEVG